MVSSRPIPMEVRDLARASVQYARSFSVYPTRVGLPVVPDETWYLTIWLLGTLNIFVG